MDSVGSASVWDEQSGLVALGVVLGSSVSLVGLAFAFITYRFVEDVDHQQELNNWCG